MINSGQRPKDNKDAITGQYQQGRQPVQIEKNVENVGSGTADTRTGNVTVTVDNNGVKATVTRNAGDVDGAFNRARAQAQDRRNLTQSAQQGDNGTQSAQQGDNRTPSAPNNAEPEPDDDDGVLGECP